MLKNLLVSLAIVVSPFALSDSGAVNSLSDFQESKVELGSEFLYGQSTLEKSSVQSVDELVLALNVNPMRPMPHDEICEAEDKSKLCYCPDSICWTFKNDCFCQ